MIFRRGHQRLTVVARYRSIVRGYGTATRGKSFTNGPGGGYASTRFLLSMRRFPGLEADPARGEEPEPELQ